MEKNNLYKKRVQNEKKKIFIYNIMICEKCDFNSKNRNEMNKHMSQHKDLDKEKVKTLDFNKISYIYVHIHKNAGTYLRFKLKKIKDCVIINHTNELVDNKKRVVNVSHLSYIDFLRKKILISFVRNPYSRVISMYYYHRFHKMHNSIDEFIEKLYKNKKIVEYIKDSSCMDKNVSFDLLKQKKGTSVAYSWKSQSTWFPNDIFFVGKIEKMDEDIRRLCGLLGWEYKEIPINKPINKTGYVKPVLKERTKEIIYELYREDFDRFEYYK
jgi:hypothetical protein